MTFSRKGNDLVIVVKDAYVSQGTPSQTGKMLLVESTHGFTRAGVIPEDATLQLSLNLGRRVAK